MKYKAASKEEEKYLQTKDDILNTLKDQKATQEKYLDVMKKLLDLWKNEFETKEGIDKDKLSELIKIEESAVKSVKDDVNKLNEIKNESRNDLEKIQEIVTSLREHQ